MVRQCLPWISDKDLDSALENLIQRVQEAQKEVKSRMQKNIVDPFSSLIIASTLSIENLDQLINIQSSHALSSAVSSAVGDFHQRILGSIDGWVNHDAGYDLENHSLKIIAEIKNKHNTMNAGNKEIVITKLETAIQQKRERDWKGYIVIIIPKRSKRYCNKIGKQSRPIYETDSSSFYDKATGYENSLHALFSIVSTRLPSMMNYSLHSDVEYYCNEMFTKAFGENPL